jgi:hypothetical protein
MTSRRHPSGRLTFLALGAAVAVLAVSAFFGERSPDATEGKEGVPVLGPCGESTTLRGATERAGFRLLAPDTPLAAIEDLEEVELCESGDVIIRYSGGITVSQSVSTLADPRAEWEQMARDYEEFAVGTVRGHPASLITPAIGSSRGGVDFVEDGIRIQVFGNGETPLADLVAVAESLRPAVPETTSE